MQISKLDINTIETIRPLWEALNLLHKERSTHFKDHFEAFSFDQRLEQFKDRDEVAVFIAKKNPDIIGYCIASVKDRTGEIDSIFMLAEYRRTGIGDRLMGKAETWLNSQAIDKIHISVAQGNESAFGFYKYLINSVLSVFK